MKNLLQNNRLAFLSCLVLLAAPLAALGQGFSGLYSQPLVGNTSAAPLFLITMQRDSRLFVEAYDDASDINGDGKLDLKYNPTLKEYDPVNKVYTTNQLDYYGYFDSYRCYEYKEYSYRDTVSNADKKVWAFVPIGKTDTGTKKCTSITKSGANLFKPWSGDFLNYMTTTRMDAMRKVLYGGQRYADFAYYNANKSAATILERAYIPRDLHAYGKEYKSIAADGYDIADYTPLSVPTAGKRHLFASTTHGASTANDAPLLRILQNRIDRAWDWIAAETTFVADTKVNNIGDTATDLNVRVVVCDTPAGDDTLLPDTGIDQHYCKKYGSGYKPLGVLHEYGENNAAYFGLLTGSYTNHFSGGVLRRAIASFTDEVDAATGIFKNPASDTKGIVYAINAMKIVFAGAGSSAYTDTLSTGNPIAEMMYEGLRYLAGQASCYSTSGYCQNITRNATTGLSNENPSLPILTTWANPYAAGGYNLCAKPTQLVISDINPTYDSDELPGSGWGSFAGSLGSLNVDTLAQTIWTAEGLGSRDLFIGEKKGSATDAGLPTTKTGITSFAMIRGLVPEDPKWQGSYYAASVAKFGKETSLKALGNPGFSSSLINTRVVDTNTVALSSALPRIQIPFDHDGDPNTDDIMVTVIPFAQTSTGSDANWKIGDFVKVFVDNVKNVEGAETDAAVNGGDPYYKLQIVFSDNSMYQGAGDNDMDYRATYEVFLNKAAKTVTVNICGDPDPTSQTVSGHTSAAQTVLCNKDGVNGIGYSATGAPPMHAGYFISGVTLLAGEKQTRLVARNNGYSSGNLKDFVNPMDLPAARLANSFYDNYYDSGSSTGLAQYTVAASDSKSLRFNHSTSYPISNTISGGEFVEHDPLWYAAKYGGYKDSNDNMALDGNEWKSDDNVTPVGYFKVVNPAKLKEQLQQAVQQKVLPPGSFAAAASNSTDMKTLNTAYQGKYIAKYWSGQLIATNIDATTGVVGTEKWNAASLIPAAASRNILTYRNETSGGVDFKWTSLLAIYNEKAKLANDSNQLDYIRGVRTKEGTGATNFRKRDPDSVLGDIVNSAPIFVGGQNFGYAGAGWTESSTYSAFVLTNSTREPMIYVGANDGMLHGFQAKDGVEKLAYIPRSTLFGDAASKLSTLIDKTYSHKYFVDGPVVANDVYTGTTWKTIIVGTQGAGGKSIFALDVTDPSALTKASVLWEFSHPELGYVRSEPVIARLNDGHWYVITGNGFESNTCKNASTPRYEPRTSADRMPKCNDDLAVTARSAKLFLIRVDPDLSDGWTVDSDYFVLHATDVQIATTPPSVTAGPIYSAGSDNGLSGPALLNGDSIKAINAVYAGDLQGNVWKFDLSSATPSVWNVGATPLFQAKDSSGLAQPITAAVAAGSNPADVTQTCVSVGTGRFVYDGDLIYKAVQSIYGFMDKGAAVARNDLQQYTILDRRDETYGTTLSTITYVSNEAVDATKKGWFMDMREKASATKRDLGERVFQTPIQTKYKNNELEASFNSSIPSGDSCDASGIGYKYSFNACSGAAMTIPPFDLNGDGIFDAPDKGTPGSNERLAGVQFGKKDATHDDATCFESKSGGVKGCKFDLALLSCTDGRIITVKRPPSALNCAITRTSWRQLR